MASGFYNEKQASQTSSSSVEPVAVGHVGKLRSRLPGFSLEVHQEESSFAVTKNASNADFDPIPPSKRTWNWGAYVAYWMADAWAVSNWEVGGCFSLYNSFRVHNPIGTRVLTFTASSMIQVGLSWKMAIGACVLGNAIMGLVITINGRMGATVGHSLLRTWSLELTFDSCTHHFQYSHACHSVTTSATLSSCPAASSLSCG